MQVLDKATLLSSHMAAQVKREIQIMTQLHHPFIVDLREVFPSREKIFMVMELVPGGELFDQIIASGPLKVPSVGRHVWFNCGCGAEHVVPAPSAPWSTNQSDASMTPDEAG